MNNQYFSNAYDGATNGFSKPVVDTAVNHPYTKELVWDCLKRISSSTQSQITRNCRLYHRGGQVNVFEAKRILDRICNFDSIDLVDWDREFGDSDFLFFINHAALYSAKLLTASRKFVGDFAERFEPNGLSIEHHLIIGRYSETPFGVHVDDSTDRVFHFNLGPKVKRMTLWARETFLEEYQQDISRPVNKVSIANSKTYDIPVGSCFFLPANYHHVGSSDMGVSTVVALAFSRQSETLLLAEAFKELQMLIPKILSTHNYYYDFEGESYYPNALLAKYDKLGLVVASQHAQARRKSNGSFSEIHPIIISPVAELVGNYILIEEKIPLQIEHNGVIYIYAAGHQASLITPALIKEFSDILRLRAFKIPKLFGKQPTEFMQSIALRAWLVATGTAEFEER